MKKKLFPARDDRTANANFQIVDHGKVERRRRQNKSGKERKKEGEEGIVSRRNEWKCIPLLSFASLDNRLAKDLGTGLEQGLGQGLERCGTTLNNAIVQRRNVDKI